MTEVIADTVEVDMRIGGQPWLLSEARVELSRNRTPNYVDINKMTPDTDAGSLFESPNELIGKTFTLNVNNELISERDTNASEETLLFKGNIANISAVGTNVYEGIAYDPSQQALNAAASGNILNQEVKVQSPLRDLNEIIIPDSTAYQNPGGGIELSEDVVVLGARDALDQVLRQSGIDQNGADIQLSEEPEERTGPRGTFSGAENLPLKFDESNLTLGSVLEKIQEETNSFWWFDREGVFHFGLPEPTVHSPELIMETSAGLTTPPYQSVKVIGSGVASKGGYSNSTQNPAEPIVKAANITFSDGEPTANKKDFDFGDELLFLTEPTFVYESQEIVTEKQAENVLTKIAQDLGEQYLSGKVTVVGFPEVEVFDVIIMPHAEQSKRDVGNFSPRQPMGGGVFGVYKVVHKINPTDGFVTDIHTAGMVGPASVLVEESSFVNGSGGSIGDTINTTERDIDDNEILSTGRVAAPDLFDNDGGFERRN
jgi:hypothetical protein